MNQNYKFRTGIRIIIPC